MHHERISRTQQSLSEANLDALVCSRPADILLVSGYWPVLGNSLAIATRDGQVALIVPDDERELALGGWATSIEYIHGGRLDNPGVSEEAVRDALRRVCSRIGLHRGAVGYDCCEAYEPASYPSMHLYGSTIETLLRSVLGEAELVEARELLAEMKSILTSHELQRLRTACQIAAHAFQEGAARIESGRRETEVADDFRRWLSIWREPRMRAGRADGFVFCMSGPNAAHACAAYQRSRGRRLAAEDFVLIHCNSYVDGYWTDITRTYLLGEPDRGQRDMFDAILEARAAAIAAVRPGVRGAEIDAAARNTLSERGYARKFKHPIGHGVGFAANDPDARPRLHPKSEDILEPGMVFNVEPGIYIEGYAGIRHCDMVLVTDTGAEVLTPFQMTFAELEVPLGVSRA